MRIIKQFEILDQLKFRKRIRINAKEGKECKIQDRILVL